MSFTKLFGSVLGLALLSACSVSPYRVPLTEAARQSLDDVYVTTAIVQRELDIHVPIQDSSAATAQFGLIGALVGSAMDASINKSNVTEGERRVAPVRESLVGYDFDALFKSSLDETLKMIDWMKVSDIAVKKSAFHPGQIVSLNNKTIAIVDTNYRLDFDLNTLRVITTVEIYEKNAFSKMSRRAIRPDVPPIYRNRFVYVSERAIDGKKTADQIAGLEVSAREHRQKNIELGMKDSTVEKIFDREMKLASAPMSESQIMAAAAERWSRNDGELLRSTLSEAVSESMAMIKEDLQLPTPTAHRDKTNRHLETEVRSNERRRVIRLAAGFMSGEMHSLPKQGS